MILPSTTLIPLLESASLSARKLSPITQKVLIGATGGKLSVTATSLDEFLRVEADCDGELEPCCVSPQQLLLLARSSDSLTLELEAGHLKVTGSGTASLSTLDAKEFPKLPEDDFKPIGINCADLAECVRSVSWATMGYTTMMDTRPYLGAVRIHGSAKEIKCTATNGNAVVVRRKASIASDLEGSIVADFAGRICSVLEEAGSGLFIGTRFLRVKSDASDYYCKLPEPIKWPDLEEYVFKFKTTKLGEIDSERLASEARISMAMEGDDNPYIRFEFTADGLLLSGKNYNATVAGDFESHFKSAVSAKNLLESLKCLSSEKVLAETTENGILKLSANQTECWLQCVNVR